MKNAMYSDVFLTSFINSPIMNFAYPEYKYLLFSITTGLKRITAITIAATRILKTIGTIMQNTIKLKHCFSFIFLIDNV